MTGSNCVGGILCARRSPSGGLEYYLIRTVGREECYSLFCRGKEGAAFFFDVCRDRGQALWLTERLAKGEVSPLYLEEVLEEL